LKKKEATGLPLRSLLLSLLLFWTLFFALEISSSGAVC